MKVIYEYNLLNIPLCTCTMVGKEAWFTNGCLALNWRTESVSYSNDFWRNGWWTLFGNQVARTFQILSLSSIYTVFVHVNSDTAVFNQFVPFNTNIANVSLTFLVPQNYLRLHVGVVCLMVHVEPDGTGRLFL